MRVRAHGDGRGACDGLEAAQTKALGGFGRASGGRPSRAPACANSSRCEAVNAGTKAISGTSAAPQHAILAVPPQQWLTQSDMPSEALAGTAARAISCRAALDIVAGLPAIRSAPVGGAAGSKAAADA